ncbi:MAG TPA: hypothetical protein VLA91_04950 [Acidimicrobiia bacterium]|nr:hypothetical protein [Acidimicrobiia bacterium]
MTVTSLHEVEESLQALDPDMLREMVHRAARSHIAVCELTSQIGGCAHVGADETRDRVDAMSVAELVAVLAPTAWMSIDLHRRLGN